MHVEEAFVRHCGFGDDLIVGLDALVSGLAIPRGAAFLSEGDLGRCKEQHCAQVKG